MAVFGTGPKDGSPARRLLVQDPPAGDRDPARLAIHTADGIFDADSVRVEVGGPAGARRTRGSVPPLRPGERTVVETAELVGAAEVYIRVDPDRELDETREGNNLSSWKADGDEWTQAALHIHSCFSEGRGSLDWQVRNAVASGYDLIWWTEHDWRIF